MKTIEEFDYFRDVPLVAVQQMDTPAARLSKGMYEVWIKPAGNAAMSTAFALLLLHHYQGVNDDESLLEPVSKYDRLASEFVPGVPSAAVGFRFSLLDTANGPVVSAVFGKKSDMSDFDDVCLEASD
ncbi:MAG: hypothetical protein UW75_C0004G0009 [Parcubacteria group bacterium GW2011_GWF2_44_8]|nr:MAG: hypothetical protein UW75_C0004G0009 [Parcubacteria group bacterium GW2011_GWF2_44_8]